jgi:Leucine-rich repeat (LRR) protein
MGNPHSKKLSAAKITNDLDLGYLELPRVPAEVRKLENLKTLNLDGNNIKTLEKTGLEKLVLVETLGLAGNQLTVFPDQISSMTSLSVLNIGFNKIPDVPASIFAALPKLKTLDLRGNKLRSLPDNLGDCCPHLKIFMCDKNELTDLPLSLSKPVFKTFTCKGNPFKKVPLVATQLQGIEKLDLSEGEIETFDVDIIMSLAKNKTLMELNLSRNRIKTIPEQTIELFGMRELDLSYNPIPINSWPEPVRKMMNLKFQFEEEMRKRLWAK